MGSRRNGVPAILLAGAILCAAAPAAGQERGTISGTVTEELSNRPLIGAQILVVGTGIGTISGAGGRYTLTNVPAGEIRVQFQLIGYKTVERTVTLGAGVTDRLDVSMAQTAIALDEVVVTGAGIATQKRKLGNTVATINSGAIENAPVRNISELLTAREPGVLSLASGGMAGEGSATPTSPRRRGRHRRLFGD